MRNLELYPITREECVRVLENVIEDIQNQNTIGDTRSLCVSIIKDFLNDNPKDFSYFVQYYFCSSNPSGYEPDQR